MKNEASHKSDNKRKSIMEDKIVITDQEDIVEAKAKQVFYFMYFRNLGKVAIFKGNHAGHKKIELPIYLFDVNELSHSNYKIARRLDELHLVFKDKKRYLHLSFSDELLKNKLGEEFRKLIKENKESQKEEEFIYTNIEWKFKIAQTLETFYFDNFRDKTDYRDILEYDYLNRFSEVYKKGEFYHYLKNRLFMGKMRIVNKRSKLNSKRHKTSQNKQVYS